MLHSYTITSNRIFQWFYFLLQRIAFCRSEIFLFIFSKYGQQIDYFYNRLAKGNGMSKKNETAGKNVPL